MAVITETVRITVHGDYDVKKKTLFVPALSFVSSLHPVSEFGLVICFRRLCDEDDELSEVEPDAVPSEVGAARRRPQ